MKNDNKRYLLIHKSDSHILPLYVRSTLAQYEGATGGPLSTIGASANIHTSTNAAVLTRTSALRVTDVDMALGPHSCLTTDRKGRHVRGRKGVILLTSGLVDPPAGMERAKVLG